MFPRMDDTIKGGLTLFSKLFTVIPCALKDFKDLFKGSESLVVK